jgi:hypothetical protein
MTLVVGHGRPEVSAALRDAGKGNACIDRLGGFPNRNHAIGCHHKTHQTHESRTLQKKLDGFDAQPNSAVISGRLGLLRRWYFRGLVYFVVTSSEMLRLLGGGHRIA